jgi:CheY-like chemotaxis protein
MEDEMADTEQYRPAVVILEQDLFFSVRLEDVVRAAGGDPITVGDADLFVAAVERTFPTLALLDLKTPGDWETAVRQCKMKPHTRQTPVYAFGSHVDVATLQKARKAGADHAWARSRMMEELVAVVERHIHPPVRHLDGCADPPSRAAVAGLLAFNQGRFFDQHEYLELAWNEESRPVRDLYQGILQVGVAFLQMERGNRRGALKMFRRGLPKLRGLADECQGINVAAFRTTAEHIHRMLSELGPGQSVEISDSSFPKFEFNNPYGGETPEELGVTLPDENETEEA